MKNIKVDIVDRKTPVKINEEHDFTGAVNSFFGRANPNEYYAFQIAVSCEGCEQIDLKYNDLYGDNLVISKENFFCINIEGTDYLGKRFKKPKSVDKSGFFVLWVSLYIPKNASGLYKGGISLIADGTELPLNLNISVEGEPLPDHGDSEPWRFSRLRWLNTYDKTCLDKPIGFYTPLKYEDNTIFILGRKIILSECGLPKAIFSSFDKNIKISEQETQITNDMVFKILTEKGLIDFDAYNKKLIKKDDAKIVIETKSENDTFTYCCKLTAEFDGFLGYNLDIKAKKEVDIEDIQLDIPYTKECSDYFMGLGHVGGYRPEEVDFKWDPAKRQNGFWMGGINGGLRCEFRGENYYPPLPLLYYKQRTLTPPDSFSNSGKGGIIVKSTKSGVKAFVYSKDRKLTKNQQLRFDFNLLVTPLKELDMKKRLSTRYTHGGDIGNIEHAKEVGATHINVHHCTDQNPYINYPFIENEKLKELIDNAHKEDIGVKVYYTIREQSDRTTELQAFRSLGDEIFMRPSNDTGTYQWNSEKLSWFAENIGTDCIPAWLSTRDASINLNGRSRFANYWIEGLRWLIDVQDIDGIYIDDTVIERDTMKRARILLEAKGNCLIDLHTCNHFNKSNGFGNNANMYMELMPYIDTLWIGEMYNYDNKPDYWLVEICGTPYGLSGEMLQDNGNPYRGMLFGITARYPQGGEALVELWRFIKEYKLEETEFWGFWNDKTPVKSDTEDIYCTLYKSDDRNIIAVASWNDVDCEVNLSFEGIDINDYNIYIPEIKHFQEYKKLDRLNLTVESKKGRIIVLERK